MREGCSRKVFYLSNDNDAYLSHMRGLTYSRQPNQQELLYCPLLNQLELHRYEYTHIWGVEMDTI